MNSSAILLLAISLLIIVSGFAWVMLRHYSQHLSRIDEELRAIKVLLSEIPKETSIRDYIFAQDRRLCDIREKLDTYSGTDVLQQHIQDQANQIIAFITTQEESKKSGVTKADLEVSLQRTNALLEKVLWSLRFDEDKYVEDTDTKSDSHEEQGKKNIQIDTKSANAGKGKDDHASMKSILDVSNDNYGAMLEYMKQSGKSGTEALQALKAAKVMHGH
jgi:hypothetical protein